MIFYSDIRFFYLILGPPGPPQNLEVEEITNKLCTLKWKAPKSDGGSPITGYYVESQSGYTSRWTKVNKTPVRQCRLEIKDIIEFNEYVYRVVAENEAGIGEPSAPTATIIAKDPFSKPGQPQRPGVSEVTKDTATITWSPPKDTGNAPITNYVVEMKAAGGFQWEVLNPKQAVTQTTFVATRLKEGTEYEFRVSAENKVGRGPASEVSAPVKYGEFIAK